MTETNGSPLNRQQAAELHHALTASSDRLFQLVLDPDPEILKALLHNPHLGQEQLLTLLKRRDLPEEIPQLIHRRCKGAISHRLLLALVRNPSSSGGLVRDLLPHLRLFELLDLCLLPGVTPDQRTAAERTLLQRLPTTPVGNKITLARRATASLVAELLKEGDARTVEACLNNPRLKEGAVFQFINGARVTATTLSMVARHQRWKQRPNLRMAILKNRHTPAIWFTLWLPQFPAPSLRQLLQSRRLTPPQQQLVQSERKRRGLSG